MLQSHNSVTYTDHTIRLQSHNSRTVSCNVQNVKYLKLLQMSSFIHFLYMYSILSLNLVLGLRVDLHDVSALENGHSHHATHSQAFPVIRQVYCTGQLTRACVHSYALNMQSQLANGVRCQIAYSEPAGNTIFCVNEQRRLWRDCA